MALLKSSHRTWQNTLWQNTFGPLKRQGEVPCIVASAGRCQNTTTTDCRLPSKTLRQVPLGCRKTQAADSMVDAVKESTRKVKMQEQRMVQMEDRAEGIDRQLDFVEETRRLADKTRADTDDVLPRSVKDWAVSRHERE